MSDIKLNEEESALFNEVGSRGDAFRQATEDRAAEAARLDRGKMIEVQDTDGVMVDNIAAGNPDPEAAPVAATPGRGPDVKAGGKAGA